MRPSKFHEFHETASFTGQVKLILSSQIQNSPPPSASMVVKLLLVLNLLIQGIHHNKCRMNSRCLLCLPGYILTVRFRTRRSSTTLLELGGAGYFEFVWRVLT